MSLRMRFASGLAVLVVLGLMLPASTISTSSGFGASAGETPILTGRLLQADGSVAANVTVTVTRLDFSGSTPDDATVSNTPVGSSTTDSGGYFTVSAPSIQIGATYEMSGIVDGDEITYSFVPEEGTTSAASKGTGRRARVQHVAPTPTVVVLKAGVGPLTTTSTATPRSVGSHPTKTLARAMAATAEDSDGSDIVATPPPGYQQPESGLPTNMGTAAPPAGYAQVASEDGKAPTKCAAVPQLSHIPKSTIYRMIPVRAIVTTAHSTQDYLYQTQEETDSGGVLTIEGDNSALGMSGGMGDSSGQSFEWPDTKLVNNTSWALEVQWDYEKWQEWCPTWRGAVKMAVTQTLPWNLAGGTAHRYVPAAKWIPCDNHHPIDSKSKFNHHRTQNWAAYFSIYGVDLNTRTTQSADTQTTVIPDNVQAGNNEASPVYCSTSPSIQDSDWFRER